MYGKKTTKELQGGAKVVVSDQASAFRSLARWAMWNRGLGSRNLDADAVDQEAIQILKSVCASPRNVKDGRKIP
jgi:hypothetical protein